MYTIIECTSIPDSFDSLFEQTMPHMETGTFNWGLVGNPTTDEAKKDAIRERFGSYCDLHPDIAKVIYWEKDGHPIHLAAGFLSPDDPDYIMWDYALYGVDANGSKGWLHDPSYISQTKDFMRNDLGLLGYTIGCIHGGSLHQYHMSKVGASENYEVTEAPTKNPDYAPDITVATIKFTYL